MAPRTRKAAAPAEETEVTDPNLTGLDVPEEAPEVKPKRGRKADPATALLRDLRKAQADLVKVNNLISGQDELVAKRDALQKQVDDLKAELEAALA